jgi:hypothetical protein
MIECAPIGTLATVAECEQSPGRLAELLECMADLLGQTRGRCVEIARDPGSDDPRVLREVLARLAELERSLEEVWASRPCQSTSSFSSSCDPNRRLETTRELLGEVDVGVLGGQDSAQIKAEILASLGLWEESRSAAWAAADLSRYRDALNGDTMRLVLVTVDDFAQPGHSRPGALPLVGPAHLGSIGGRRSRVLGRAARKPGLVCELRLAVR